MIFAPVIRRAAYAQAPRSADLALQRFLMGALAQPAAAPAAGCTVTPVSYTHLRAHET